MSIKFLPAMLIAVLVALVAVGGAALAVGQSANGNANAENQDDLLERAAGKLGIEADELKGAYTQAQSEHAEEQVTELINRLVEAGIITQDEASETLTWLDARPTAFDRIITGNSMFELALRVAPVIATSHGFETPVMSDDVIERMATVLGIEPGELREALAEARAEQLEAQRSAAIDALINGFVEDGEITADEGQELRTWFEEMPAWMSDPDVFNRILMRGAAYLFGSGQMPPWHAPLEDGRRGPLIIPRLAPGDEEGVPQFEFTIPHGEGPGGRFYFGEPEFVPGQGFEFNGENQLPGYLEDLLGDMNGQFDLEKLFEGHPFLQQTPVPATPTPDNSTAEDESNNTTGKSA